MVVTFLVAIDVPDITNLPAVAEDIMDDLATMGHLVESVAPWARPTLPQSQPAGGFTSLNTPPPLPPSL